MRRTALAVLAFAAVCSAQQACEEDAAFCKAGEKPLKYNVYWCTKAGGCAVEGNTYLTMDANWRWTQRMGTWTNCWEDGWITPECSGGDQEACSKTCMLEGVDYQAYGVTVSDGDDKVKMMFQGQEKNTGARLYVIEKTGTGSKVGEQWRYKPFDLRNKEMTFTVEMKTLGCGVNGPAYLVEMPLNGGYDGTLNTAGALYGTGYCDAQCPGDVNFVNGLANSPIEPKSESAYKACCAEMDLFEANTINNALTPHPVMSGVGLWACTDAREECRKKADTAGCDWATYRLQYFNGGNMPGTIDYYGNGMTIDTTKEFTVVTQFLTHDGTDTGDLTEIRRVYVQGGRTIPHMTSVLAGKTVDSLTDEVCKDMADIFDDGDEHFARNGGMKGMGDALARGMTMVLSLWDDTSVNMRWLDGKFPPQEPDNKPGAIRGTCAPGAGPPTEPRSKFANNYVWFSKLMWGELDSTYDASGMPPPPAPVPVPGPVPVPVPVPPMPVPVPVPVPAPVPVPVPAPVPSWPVPPPSPPTPAQAANPPPAGSCDYLGCMASSQCCGGNRCYEMISGFPYGMCVPVCHAGWSCRPM